MNKKILGIIGIVVGAGLALFLAFYFLFPEGLVKPPSMSPVAQPQLAARPASNPTPKSEVPTAQPATPPETAPPASGPATPPAVVPVPTPAPPPVEKPIAPLPPLESKKEHGLVVGKFRRYKDAQRRLDKIKKKNMPGFIRKEGKYYKVWVGPFKTPQEAEHARKSLRAALKISPKRGEYEVPVPK
jgi:cell division septation protein DedD